jgi:hypothetical protein
MLRTPLHRTAPARARGGRARAGYPVQAPASAITPTTGTHQGETNMSNTVTTAAPATSAAAMDEAKAVAALVAAGWAGRTATATLAAATKVAQATGRLAANAADEELATAAAKAAGATGIAGHDRARAASAWVAADEEGIDPHERIAKAAANASPTREGTARALVWYLAAMAQAEQA